MKKQIILLLTFLLLLTGCKPATITVTDVTSTYKPATITVTDVTSTAKESSEADISSIVIPKEPSISLTENSVPNESSVTSKATSTPAKSHVTNQKESSTRSFTFKDLSQSKNDSTNYWVLEYNAKGYPSVMLCNTASELQHSLTEQYGLSGEALSSYLAAYPESYFQTNSLLLLQLTKNNTGVRLSVDDISITEQKLQVALTVSDPQNGGAVAQEVLYHVEVQGKLEKVTTADCSVTYVKNETASHNRYTVSFS